MMDILVSMLGVPSKKPMTTWTILVIACLSWPCFLESRSTCSFNCPHSPFSLHNVTMVTMRRDVEARSEAWQLLAGRRVWRRGLGETYLTGLLLEREELLNSGLKVALAASSVYSVHEGSAAKLRWQGTPLPGSPCRLPW